MTISLSDQQARRIQQAVETGDYASNSEVVRDALRLWDQREREADATLLKRAYGEGLASGPGRPATADGLLKAFKGRRV